MANSIVAKLDELFRFSFKTSSKKGSALKVGE